MAMQRILTEPIAVMAHSFAMRTIKHAMIMPRECGYGHPRSVGSLLLWQQLRTTYHQKVWYVSSRSISFAMVSDKEVNSSSVLNQEVSPEGRLNPENGHLRDPVMFRSLFCIQQRKWNGKKST